MSGRSLANKGFSPYNSPVLVIANRPISTALAFCRFINNTPVNKSHEGNKKTDDPKKVRNLNTWIINGVE